MNGVICTDPVEISLFLSSFFEKFYKFSLIKLIVTITWKEVRVFVPVIADDAKSNCDADLSPNRNDSPVIEKAPGVDGLSVEFLVNDYSNFLFLLVEIFQLKTYQ